MLKFPLKSWNPTVMNRTIRNDKGDEARISESHRGGRRLNLKDVAAGGKLKVSFENIATYFEDVLFGSSTDTLYSMDDREEYSEISIQEGPDGAFIREGTKIRHFRQNLEAAHRSAQDVSLRFDKASQSCGDLEKLCERAKICRHQCNHLLQIYKEGIQKMAQLYSLLIQDDVQIVNYYKDDRLTKLEKSLDRLEYILCDAKDLLGSCAEDLGKVALAVFIPRPPAENDMGVHSDFDLLNRELEWHLEVIEYLIEPSGDAKFVWSPTTCRYVLAQKKAPDHEKARSSARMDREELQSGLRDGSIHFPNAMMHDTILKRCETQDPQSRSMDLEAFKIDHLDLDLQYTCTDGELRKRKFKKLGGGSTKKVYGGNWYGQSVAIATINLGIYSLDDPDVPGRSLISPTPSEKGRKAASEILRKEVTGLLQLQHPKVVSLFGWAETTDGPAPFKKLAENYCVHGGYIVTERMECSLDKLIQMHKGGTSRNDSGPFSYSVGIDILLQIVEAMLHVHKHGVMHRDLKPGNFLVNPRSSPAGPGADTYYNVKLIDFGSSKVFVRENGNTYNKGTTSYGAPEMMKGSKGTVAGGKYGMSVDVYSFAMTCYQVITGRILYEGFDIAEQIRNKKKPPIPSFVLHGLRTLTEDCWQDNPKRRPSFKEIQKRLWTIKMTLALEECWDASPKEEEFYKGLADIFQGKLAVALLTTLALLALALLATLLLLTSYFRHLKSG